MLSKEQSLNIFKQAGLKDAQELQSKASTLTDTEILAEENKIPAWNPNKDYTSWKQGYPVTYQAEGEDAPQVYGLLIPHNASHYPGTTPANSPSLWSIKHTKDARKAKPYKAPNGTSGLMMKDECCLYSVEGVTHVFRCNQDNTAYSPADYPSAYTDLGAKDKLEEE